VTLTSKKIIGAVFFRTGHRNIKSFYIPLAYFLSFLKKDNFAVQKSNLFKTNIHYG
jgi:hypothetical protein